MASRQGMIRTTIALGIAFTLGAPLTASAQAAGGRSQPPLHKAAVVQALKQVAAADKAAAAVAAALHRTRPRQAPETFARFFTTGAGIWACCAARRKSI